MLLSMASQQKPRPIAATTEATKAENISSNVPDIPRQQETLATLSSARERLNETLDAARQPAGEACEYPDQVVRANPWSSIGVGFGVGVLVGVLATLASTSSSRRWSV